MPMANSNVELDICCCGANARKLLAFKPYFALPKGT